MGEEVPLDEFVEEDEVLGDMLRLILAFLLDIDPLLSLGDKLEFLLDDLEEFGLDTRLPFLVGDPEIPERDCLELAEYAFDLTGTGLNVFG